jgi:ATP-binding cassette subfamily B protein/subfamily B ATP-binding cassette protein MsbA
MANQKVAPPEHFKLDDKAYEGYKPEVLGGIIDFIKPYSRSLWISSILMVIGSIVPVIGPYLVQMALDDGIVKNDPATLQLAMIIYLVASFAQWIATYIRVNIMSRAGQSVIFDIRAKLFAHIQSLSMSFFSHYSVGRLISRVINDVSVLRMFVTWAILAVARNIITLAGIIVAMVIMDWKLSLITFSVLPLIGVATFVFRKYIRDIYRRVRAGISWVNSVLAENINGVRVIQAFSRQEKNFDDFSQNVNKYHLQNNLQSARIVSVFFPTIDIIGTFAVSLVIWITAKSWFNIEVSTGVLAAFIIYIERFFRPIQDLSRRFDQFQASMIGGERILELLNTKADIEDHPDAYELPKIKGKVEFDKVNFHYTDDPNTIVLNDIDLKVEPGQTIALVGETGAGKTTLIKLLSRFYDVNSGSVKIDGHDVKEVTQASLRSQMGVVLQEPFLFGGSVFDNIQFGRLDASKEEVFDAAKAVGAHEFISNLKKGYDTSVEEGGALLSVGQRQLISFARALLANPRILILDEATSSVDTQTELVIQNALKTLLKGRTSFVIAHRLSTIVNSDQIFVVDQGRIVEQGTHMEMLANKGIYYNLYRMGFHDQEQN